MPKPEQHQSVRNKTTTQPHMNVPPNKIGKCMRFDCVIIRKSVSFAAPFIHG